MKKDIGFWDINGNYIPDIQEVSEVEMEEEITIDGVDVAGCEYYFESIKTVDTCKWFGCKCNSVSINECKYKQLKQLEQENAKLKGTIDAYQMSENEAIEIIAELKVENERLKEELEIESLTDNTTGEIFYRSNVCNKLRNKNLKLKKILQEIKEIVEKGQWDFAGVTENQILQKISEVE